MKSGHVVVLSYDAVIADKKLAENFHILPVFGVSKAGSIAGRTVIDASIGKGSLNAHADKERMDLEIPLVPTR
jgi:hypothetical protein